MFERYSERARRTIFHARQEALQRFSREIEPRDILIGLTYEVHQPGCPFAMLHENASELRALASIEPTAYGPPESWQIPLSREGKMVLAYAAEESDRDRRYTIGSHHLLRGVLRAGGEIGNKLTQAGYSLPAMRKASEVLYRSTPDAAVISARQFHSLGWRITKYRLRLLVLAVFIYLVVDLLYVHWHP